jgi:DNA-directed RNA polymerase specialized sigma24 family protein
MSQGEYSTQIQRCIDRIRAGDASARDELLARATARLTRLTRKMLRDFPDVHRWEETDDVLQNAVVRLCRVLGEVFDLLFYQGLAQAEAAAVLGVAEITIKRRWRAARMRLVQALGGRLPGL